MTLAPLSYLKRKGTQSDENARIILDEALSPFEAAK